MGEVVLASLMLASAATRDWVALVAQTSCLLIAIMIGRFACKSRNAVWLIAFTAALVAMASSILNDGQGAFLLILYAPLIYFFCVAGRSDLR